MVRRCVRVYPGQGQGGHEAQLLAVFDQRKRHPRHGRELGNDWTGLGVGVLVVIAGADSGRVNAAAGGQGGIGRDQDLPFRKQRAQWCRKPD